MRFSVFLPVRNGGGHFRECVAAVLAQTHPDLSLVVLDNASTDGTAEWASALDDPRVTVVRSAESLGIEASWRRIRDLPKEQFSTIIGHDDVLDPHFLEIMAGLIGDQPEASLYHAHFRLIDADGVVVRSCRPMPAIEDAAQFLRARLTFSRDSFGTGHVFRSAKYDGVGGMPSFANLLYADDALWLSILGSGFTATAAEECFSYRLHPASTSFSPDPDGAYDALDSFVGFLHDASNDPAIREVVCANLPGHLVDMYRWAYFAQRRERGLGHHDRRHLRARIESSARFASVMLESADAPRAADFPAVVRRELFVPGAYPVWRLRSTVRAVLDRRTSRVRRGGMAAYQQ